jgi:putative two-component system response regulator
MKTHAEEGGKIVKKFYAIEDKEYVDFAYQIANSHHERWDGGGYPKKLKGNEIPICAQVAGIADVYDALTNQRVYKPAYTHEEAVSMICNGECGQFSPSLIKNFLAVEGELKKMARMYSDMPESNLDDSTTTEESVQVYNGSMYEFDHYKYLTLLHIIGGIVVELDLDKNYYNIAYPNDRVYFGVKIAGKIDEGLQEFLQDNVAPNDIPRLNKRMEQYRKGVFGGKMLESISTYRSIKH